MIRPEAGNPPSAVDPTASRDIARAVAELRQLLGDRLSTAEAVLHQHGIDESYHPPHPPDAVAFVSSTEEVAAVVGVCAKHRCPVIPFGAGTSLEGHIAALHGGVSLDLSGLDRILEIHPDDLDCRVEAGVTRQSLNRSLAEHGLFFPVDPGAEATLGGMAATGASGTNAVRYGTFRENVLGLTVVTAEGRVIRTGGRARKSSAGYDLTRLMIGSEGTLGVITELQVRVHGLPEQIAAAVCPFQTLEGAVRTAVETIQSGVPVARMELLNEAAIDASNRYSQRQDPVAPTLFLEFHGSPAGVEEQADAVQELATENGGRGFRWATDAQERKALWHARHHCYWACLALKPGAKGWPTDVCVPVSCLADAILKAQEDIEEHDLLAPIVGHVGDGNFHLSFVLDPEDKDEMARAQEVNRRMVERALAVGGTATGEHGVGYGKISWVEKQHGEGVEWMRSIKRALDPLNILNPGKVIHL